MVCRIPENIKKRQEGILQWTSKEIEENNRRGKTGDIFKKTGNIKGIFHANMGTIKNRESKDLIEAEEIKKRWQEYIEELYKKDLNDLDNYDGVITNLEPDILECEIKGALGNSTTNKVSGGDRIPAELFQIHMTDFPKKDILLVGPRQSPWNTNSSCCILINALGQMESQYRHIRRKPPGFLNHILMVIGSVHLE